MEAVQMVIIIVVYIAQPKGIWNTDIGYGVGQPWEYSAKRTEQLQKTMSCMILCIGNTVGDRL